MSKGASKRVEERRGSGKEQRIRGDSAGDEAELRLKSHGKSPHRPCPPVREGLPQKEKHKDRRECRQQSRDDTHQS